MLPNRHFSAYLVTFTFLMEFLMENLVFFKVDLILDKTKWRLLRFCDHLKLWKQSRSQNLQTLGWK